MFKDVILMPSHRYLWSLLALQGGMVNVAGFLAVHRFVSHVTGFAGHFGLAFVAMNWVQAMYAFLVPIAFLSGSIFSAYFTERRRREQARPIYRVVLFTIAGLFLLVAVLGQAGGLGYFGEAFHSLRDFALLLILSFCCGSQNALFTRFSNSIIRTTHLTGLTTDLGIGLVRQIVNRDVEETKINRIRVTLIVSFLIGSVLGAGVFREIEFAGFYINAALSLFIADRLMRAAHRREENGN